jgi:hypothetical protein
MAEDDSPASDLTVGVKRVVKRCVSSLLSEAPDEKRRD